MFASFLKESTIDYPGKLACVAYVAGCNMRCPYCHNSKLAAATNGVNIIAAEGIVDYISKHKDTIEALVITGGEPGLLNDRDLYDLMRDVQQYGVVVKVDTNGLVNLRSLRRYDTNNLYIALDWKGTEDVYNYLRGLTCGSGILYGTLLQHWDWIKSELENDRMIGAELRTTVHKAMLTPEILRQMGKEWEHNMEGVSDRVRGLFHWYLQPFRPCECFDMSLNEKETYTPEELKALADEIGAEVRA